MQARGPLMVEHRLIERMIALASVVEKLGTLAEFYPKHIEKEDKVFFPASRAYLTHDEEQRMLAEFWEFDRKMIHEKYTSVVEELGANVAPDH